MGETLKPQSEIDRLTSSYAILADELLGTKNFESVVNGVHYNGVYTPGLNGVTDTYCIGPIMDLDAIKALAGSFHLLNRRFSQSVKEGDLSAADLEKLELLQQSVFDTTERFDETWLCGDPSRLQIDDTVVTEFLLKAQAQGYKLQIASNEIASNTKKLNLANTSWVQEMPDYVDGLVNAFGDEYPEPISRTYAGQLIQSIDNPALKTFLLTFRSRDGIAACSALHIYTTPNGQKYSCFQGTATHENHRGNGLQKALLAVRQHISAKSGICPENRIVFVQDGGTSERNCIALGFKRVGENIYIYEA